MREVAPEVVDGKEPRPVKHTLVGGAVCVGSGVLAASGLHFIDGYTTGAMMALGSSLVLGAVVMVVTFIIEIIRRKLAPKRKKRREEQYWRNVEQARAQRAENRRAKIKAAANVMARADVLSEPHETGQINSAHQALKVQGLTYEDLDHAEAELFVMTYERKVPEYEKELIQRRIEQKRRDQEESKKAAVAARIAERIESSRLSQPRTADIPLDEEEQWMAEFKDQEETR